MMDPKNNQNPYGLDNATDVPAEEEDYTLEEILEEFGGSLEQTLLRGMEPPPPEDPPLSPDQVPPPPGPCSWPRTPSPRRRRPPYRRKLPRRRRSPRRRRPLYRRRSPYRRQLPRRRSPPYRRRKRSPSAWRTSWRTPPCGSVSRRR